MTWPERIAAVLGVLALSMIWASQYGLTPRTTRNPIPQDGDPP